MCIHDPSFPHRPTPCPCCLTPVLSPSWPGPCPARKHVLLRAHLTPGPPPALPILILFLPALPLLSFSSGRPLSFLLSSLDDDPFIDYNSDFILTTTAIKSASRRLCSDLSSTTPSNGSVRTKQATGMEMECSLANLIATRRRSATRQASLQWRSGWGPGEPCCVGGSMRAWAHGRWRSCTRSHSQLRRRRGAQPATAREAVGARHSGARRVQTAPARIPRMKEGEGGSGAFPPADMHAPGPGEADGIMGGSLALPCAPDDVDGSAGRRRRPRRGVPQSHRAAVSEV